MTLGLIGLKKNIDISIRENFSIRSHEKEETVKKLLKHFNEVVVLNTCNRTEIYIEYNNFKDYEILDIIFSELNWNKKMIKYVFLEKGYEVPKHLYEVACGFHSKILGEDQIIGQIRDSYLLSLRVKACKSVLSRMFEGCISCSRDFKSNAKLYEIPVSSISIVVDKFKNMNISRIMVLGYGVIGKLAVKYLLNSNIDILYIVVRDKNSVKLENDKRVKVITFKEKNNYINNVNGIIGCTAAPHAVVLKGDIEAEGPDIYCFDMAVPRDIHKDVLALERVKTYNIDEISNLNDKNKKLRKKRMMDYKYIVKNEIEAFIEYLKYREISSDIKHIKDVSEKIYLRRYKTYLNKRQNFCKQGDNSLEEDNTDSRIVKMLFKSTSDYYLHRSIEVLKEEKLKGREKECLRILEKIFKEEKK